MLILGRKPDERIQIGDDITVIVVEIREGHVAIGVEAPADIRIDRKAAVPRTDATRRTQHAKRSTPRNGRPGRQRQR